MSRDDGMRSVDRQPGDRRASGREPRQREDSRRVASRREAPRGSMPEWVTMMFAALALLIGGAIVKTLVPHLKSASDKADAAGQAVSGVASTIAAWLPTVAIALLALLAIRWWLRRRARRRRDQQELIRAVLARLMPADWSAYSLVVTRWRGMRPMRLEWPLTSSTADHEPEWREKIEAALTKRLDVHSVDVQWPTTMKRVVKVVVPTAEAVEQHRAAVVAEEAERVAAELEAEQQRLALEEAERVAAEEAAQAARAMLETDEGRLFLALDGLVPDPHVEVTARKDSGEMSEITLTYGETNRDISPNWRGRVLTKVIQRFGGQWRSEWHTQERRVVLRAVPALPHPVPWKTPKLWEDVLYGSAPIGVYGVTEEGHVVGHELGSRQPHALVVGPTGTGKTETMKAQMASLMLQGVIQVVIAPKPEDWVVFLGMPGVAAVATSAEDRAEVIAAVWKHMKRRVNARALFAMKEMHPNLEIDLPELSVLDQCYMQVVIDEVTQNLEDLTTWWQQLSREDKEDCIARWGKGSISSKTPPQVDMLKEIAQLARSARVHLLEGMQRPDLENFGDNTQMRDNFPNRTSMGSMYPIGSEQIWGDRQTGVIPISNVGEGMTNGARFHRGKQIGVGVPVRYKGVYISDSVLLSEEFQAQLVEIAPDVSEMDMGDASAETRSIAAAAMGLRRRAGYGSGTGGGSVDLDRDRRRRRSVPAEGASGQLPPADQPAPVQQVESGSTALMPAADVVVEPGTPSEQPKPVSTVETDASGHQWEVVRPRDLKVGDVITLAEIPSATVQEEPEETEDEFNGDPVIRVVIRVGSTDQELDLDRDDELQRRLPDDK